MNRKDLIEHLTETGENLQKKSENIKAFLESTNKLSEEEKNELIKLLMERNLEILQLLKTQSTADCIVEAIDENVPKIFSSKTKKLKEKIYEFQKKAKNFKDYFQENLNKEIELFNSKK